MNELDKDNLTPTQQARMCELCESHILGCKHSTSTFLCEGSRCDDAIELLIDEVNEAKLEEEQDNKDKPKYPWLK